MRLGDIAQVVGGVLHPSAQATPVAEVAQLLIDGDVVTDSRLATAGSLYVARVGAVQDGHEFVGAARAAGAVAALTTRPVPELPCVVVPEVQQAFARLAGEVVRRVPELTVVGITGSSGKTTTKDLLAGVLSGSGPTVANAASLNNEVGVPLTACRVGPDTRHLIVEMGARGIGHIRYLTEMVRPTVGVVLNVGSAHAGEFGGPLITAEAKGELVEALPPEGLAILNRDDPLVAAMASRTAARVIWTGRGPDVDVSAQQVRLDRGRARFRLVAGAVPGAAPGQAEEAEVALTVLGLHQVDNALAAAAVAIGLGMPVAQVAQRLSDTAVPSRYRMELHERDDGVTVLNDAYNANPESMGAALRTLAHLAAPGRPGPAGRSANRTWAVLGEMLELGADSVAAHQAVGALAAELGIDHLVAVGEGARPILTGASASAGADAGKGDGAGVGAEAQVRPHRHWVPDAGSAWELMVREHRAGDVILVKSSHSIGLWSLGDRLAREVLAS